MSQCFAKIHQSVVPVRLDPAQLPIKANDLSANHDDKNSTSHNAVQRNKHMNMKEVRKKHTQENSVN